MAEPLRLVMVRHGETVGDSSIRYILEQETNATDLRAARWYPRALDLTAHLSAR